MTTPFVNRSRTAALAADVREHIARSFWFLLPLLAAAIVLASAANAATGSQRRVALVIGNASYQYVPHLPNPTNDAEAMAATLQRLGFEVTKGINLDHAETELIIRQFSKTLPGADVALLFYAGHGIQYQGGNYLIPVDAQLKDETDLTFETTQLDVVMRLMEREPRVSLVFLDACRDNPFAQQLARSMGSTRSTSLGRGLAIVDAVAGSFVAYATDPNQVALDGDGAHSPFTAALLSHMETPGLSISDMMIEVRNDVLNATQNKQRPREDNALTSKFYFASAVAVDVAAVNAGPTPSGGASTGPVVQPVDKEVVFWHSIENSGNPNDYQAYLDQYPNGSFTALARSRLDGLKAKPAESTRSNEVVTVSPSDTTVSTAEQDELSLGLTKQGRSRAQLALTLLGYKTGGTDGSFGPKSRAAISAWQTDQHETVTGYLTAKQHAALLDVAGPKLAAWDADQKRKAAEAQAAAAAAAKQQQATNGSSGTTTVRSTSNTQAQQAAEAERLRQENEQLKKQAQAQSQAQEDRENTQIGIGIFNSVIGGASLFK
jgi:peptidoglycan hydrolase-like protein with peptidoglycan-binding domain